MKNQTLDFEQNCSSKINPVSNTNRIVLNSKTTIGFVRDQGIPMSASKLYKLSAKNGLPFRKTAGGRLIFYSDDLKQWCENQILNPKEINIVSTNSVVQSAQNKKLS